MSRKLVLQIANSQLAEAKETLNEELVEIMAAKLHEKKKMIAAGAMDGKGDHLYEKDLDENENQDPGRNHQSNSAGLSAYNDQYKKNKKEDIELKVKKRIKGALGMNKKDVSESIKQKVRKAIKEAMSAKEAAAKAEELVTRRTKESEKARLSRNNAGYPNRGSDAMNIHDKTGETFGDWKKRKGKE